MGVLGVQGGGGVVICIRGDGGGLGGDTRKGRKENGKGRGGRERMGGFLNNFI